MHLLVGELSSSITMFKVPDNCPPSWAGLIYTSTSIHVSKIYFDMHLPSMARSSKNSFSFRFLNPKPTAYIPHTCHSGNWQLEKYLILYYKLRIFMRFYLGTAVAEWLRCCATNRKVAGSIPAGVIGIFHRHKILPIAVWPWGWPSL